MLMMTALSYQRRHRRPTLVYGSAGADNSDTATPSIAGLSIGAAHSNRRVFACVGWSAGGAATLVSATIGGIAATIVTQALSSSGNGGCAIIMARVPTGTTATVALNFSSPSARTSVATYSCEDLHQDNAYSVMTPDTAASSGVVTGTLNVPMGFLIAMATTVDGSAWSWSAGPTEDSDQFLESSSAHSSASKGYDNPVMPETVTATCATGSRAALVAAAWGN